MTQNNLLAALEQEYSIHALYQTCNNQWGRDYPFLGEFVATQEQQINALLFLLSQRGIPATNTFANAVLYDDVLETVLIQENNKIQFYNQLLSTETDVEVQDVFYRFQAISYNNHLPIVRKELAKIYQGENTATQSDIEKSKQLIAEAQTLMNDFKQGTVDEKKIQNFLGNLNYSLVGGVILGGISAMILNEFLNKNKE